MHTNPRLIAARLIHSLIQHQGSISTLLPAAASELEERERPLLQQLVYGCCREFFRLQAIAERLLHQPLRQRDEDLLALILLGLYQLREMRIPAHAAISETVDCVDGLGKPRHRGLVNALLRRYQREREALDATLSRESDAFRYNHPSWMLDKLRHNWPDHWTQLIAENDHKGPMTLRVNEHLLTRDAMLSKLSDAGFDAYPGQLSRSTIYLHSPCDTARLPGFATGEISVQDEAAQLSADLLQLQPGQRVLDACAAPGGKLCHLLEREPALTQVIALELNPQRAERIRANLERQNLASRCDLRVADAASDEWWDGEAFDRILLDAPCSGSGVIRRNPDIKLLRRNEDLVPLASLQLQLLEALWRKLKPGGLLLYATCSVFPQENERVIERFSKLYSDLHVEPVPLDAGLDRTYGRQLFPQRDGHDGFFYACLRKQPSQGN